MIIQSKTVSGAQAELFHGGQAAMCSKDQQVSATGSSISSQEHFISSIFFFVSATLPYHPKKANFYNLFSFQAVPESA